MSHPETRTRTRTTHTQVRTGARIGAVLWIIAAVQFMAVQLAVGAAWRTPYSWVRNNISDLGNVHCRTWDVSRPRYVCSPLHDLMNTSFVVHGALLLAGALMTGAACWGRGGMSLTSRILFLIQAAAWGLVGFVPADVDENLHVLGALIIMGFGNLGLLCAGFLRRGSLLGGLRPFTLAVAVVASAAAGMFFGQYDPGIGMGTLERLAAFGTDAWVLVAALAVLRRCVQRVPEEPGAAPVPVPPPAHLLPARR
ncbi:DUF998 domain-containing protein [Streptomyces sp. NPDC048483]|uniref:DUF998 domain-containing protein n=1 Tax=Streptomyces sp. NPDC048483 TaxID=3154927 RepID=UPI0034176273